MRKLKYQGNMMRISQRYELLQLISRDKVYGKPDPGTNNNIANLRKLYNTKTSGLFYLAIKVQRVKMIGNIR